MEKLREYSYSKVTHFYNCLFSYWKRYFDKIPDEKHGTSEFGSFVHFILEKYEKNELKLNELLNYYTENYDYNVISTFDLQLGENFTKNFAKDYYQSGLDYFKTFDGFKDWKILESEYEFKEPVGNKFIFTGKIDLVVEDSDGNLIVCDHKSKKKFNSKKELAQYAKQMYLYSYAVYKKYKRFPKYLVFNMFRNNAYIQIDFDIKEYASTLQWLISSVDEIENCMDFYPIYGSFYCRNFCGCRNNNYEECQIAKKEMEDKCQTKKKKSTTKSKKQSK